MKFVFFGTPDIAVTSLRALVESGQKPSIVVTQPDRPAGRGNVLTPPAVKVYAERMGIEVVQIESVTDEFVRSLASSDWDCFILVAFGMILPQRLLDVPRMGTLNMHPSLLPRLRGPSPIRTAILRDEHDAVGVTVMLIDCKMDHGPILAQKPLALPHWPMMGKEVDVLLAEAGGALLAETLPRYVSGEITPSEQDHAQATYCKYIEKAHAEINLTDDAYENYLKICAYDGWPSAYTYVEKNGVRVRVKILTAHLENNNTKLVIDTCIPEGKKEMPWTVFVQ
jgi:methionyl-tRNA formyltransferase